VHHEVAAKLIFDPNQGGFEEMNKYTLWTAVAIWRKPNAE